MHTAVLAAEQGALQEAWKLFQEFFVSTHQVGCEGLDGGIVGNVNIDVIFLAGYLDTLTH